jgi:small subunit ribosomal protein S21
MLIIQIKEGDNIEKALKKYKKKFEKTGVVKQLRERQKFTKPSVSRRQQVIKAVYKQKLAIGAIEQ